MHRDVKVSGIMAGTVSNGTKLHSKIRELRVYGKRIEYG